MHWTLPHHAKSTDPPPKKSPTFLVFMCKKVDFDTKETGRSLNEEATFRSLSFQSLLYISGVQLIEDVRFTMNLLSSLLLLYGNNLVL